MFFGRPLVDALLQRNDLTHLSSPIPKPACLLCTGEATSGNHQDRGSASKEVLGEDVTFP
jgi:hypothetical protein